MFEGSFGIVLEKDYEQIEFQTQYSNTSKVLNDFFYIMENSFSGMQLIETISPLGQRTVNHYRNWINNLKESAVSIEVNWTDESARVRQMDIKYSKMDEILFTLDDIQNITDEDVILTSTLTGINIRNNTFELRDENLGIIKGRSMMETLIGLSSKISQEVTAHLIKSTSVSKTNTEHSTWFLSETVE